MVSLHVSWCLPCLLVVPISFSLDAFMGGYLTEGCCLRGSVEGLESCHVMGGGGLGAINGLVLGYPCLLVVPISFFLWMPLVGGI